MLSGYLQQILVEGYNACRIAEVSKADPKFVVRFLSLSVSGTVPINEVVGDFSVPLGAGRVVAVAFVLRLRGDSFTEVSY